MTGRYLIAIIMIVGALALSACSDDASTPDSSSNETSKMAQTEHAGTAETTQVDKAETTGATEAKQTGPMKMTIDGTEISVKWEDNASVKAINSLTNDGPLTIRMSAYQDFEQVGDIGTEIPEDNKSMTTSPGDIVLYSGNQMVIFYGSNTWDYTKLGSIENMSEAELGDLLGKESVEVVLE